MKEVVRRVRAQVRALVDLQQIPLELWVRHQTLLALPLASSPDVHLLNAPHYLLHDLLAGLHTRAIQQHLGEVLHTQGRCDRKVDTLPIVLDVLFDDLDLFHLARVPVRQRVVDEVPARVTWLAQIPALLEFFPLLEQPLRHFLCADIRILVLGLPRHHVHHPICWVLVGRHAETQPLEIQFGLLRGAEEGSPPTLAEQQHVVDERKQTVSGLVDDHDDGHAELRHLLEHPDQQQRACRIQP
mmetsp:Transcript_20322/g.51982  ORF Transcript_20322/g.51982 Transcript_20322/m.51982 type:complete len:242 (-) Transcript_20322:84-809(-)